MSSDDAPKSRLHDMTKVYQVELERDVQGLHAEIEAMLRSMYDGTRAIVEQQQKTDDEIVRKLKEQFNELQEIDKETIDSLEKEIEALRGSNKKKLDDTHENFTKELARLSTQEQDFRSEEKTRLEREIESLNTSMKSKAEDLEQSQEEVLKQGKEIAALQVENSSLQEEADKIKEILKVKAAEMEGLGKRLNAASARVSKLEAELKAALESKEEFKEEFKEESGSESDY